MTPMINIFQADGTILKTVPVTSQAEHVEEMMKSNYVKLQWNDVSGDALPVGAYITYEGTHYTLFEEYRPAQKDELEYTYEPHFQHPMMILAYTPCLYTTYKPGENPGDEPIPVKQTDWDYVGTLGTICEKLQLIIAEELNMRLYIEITVKTTTNVPASAQCSFSGADIMTAIGEVCSQFGDLEYCIDWDNGKIYIGDIALGETAIELTEGENVTFASVNSNSAQASEQGNYYIVRGGTRNITLQTASGDNVQTSERLELNPDDYPGSIMDEREDKVNDPKLQRILIFDDVYPKLDLYVYNLRKRIRRLLRDGKPIVKEYNQDGTVRSYRTYAVYYLRLAYPTDAQFENWQDFTVDPTRDIVNGKNLMASFEPNEEGTHSELAGREFEMISHTAALHIDYSEDDKGVIDSGIDIAAGDYEIVFQQDDELIIPNEDTLEPWGGNSPSDPPSNLNDIVVLFNIVMTGDYLTSAQTTLADRAEKEIIRRSLNYNTYQVNSIAAAFHEDNPGLTIGCKVNFNKANGTTLESRVTALTTKLDYSEVQTISISNAIIKGATQALKEEVKAISTAIEINETSATTINKMISQLYRALREFNTTFLHKDMADTTPYDLGVGGSLDVVGGVSMGGDLIVGKDRVVGNQIVPLLKSLISLSKLYVGGDLETENYSKMMSGGIGWGIDHDGNMQVESLEVRSALRVLELVYNRLSAEESEYVFTEAGTIKEVEPQGNNIYVCTLDKRNDTDFHAFHYGDVLRGVVNNLANLGGGEYYTSWMYVTDTDTSVHEGETERRNTITVQMYGGSDCPSGTNYPPQPHMVVQRWGNKVVPSAETHADERSASFIEEKNGEWVNRRQSCWYISSIEKRIMFLDHVFQPKINEGNYAAFFGLPVNISSFKGHSLDETQPYIYVRGAFLQDLHFINYLGKEYKIERFRGEWSQAIATAQPTDENYDPYITDYTSYQTVTWNNCKWECVSEEPATGEPTKENTTEWKLLQEEIVTPVYTLITNVKTVLRDSEGTPSVDKVKCYVRKTMNGETINDTENNLGYLYYSVNGENKRKGSFVKLAKGDGITKIRFTFYPRKTDEMGSAVMGQSKFGMTMIEAVVDVLDEARGERGAVLRGPSEWKVGVEYQGGEEGKDFQDMVVRTVEGVTSYYLCHVTHTSNNDNDPFIADNHPVSGWTQAHPWEASNVGNFVATKVLFAERGKIENADIKDVTIRGTLTEDSKKHNKIYINTNNPDAYREQYGIDYDVNRLENLVEIVGSDVVGKEGSLYSVSCEPAVLGDDWDTVERINNQIVQLPTYDGYYISKKSSQSNIWFHSNPYKIAGTRLSIFTTQDVQKNWWGFDFDGSANNYVNLLNEGVLVCADPESLLGHFLTSGTDLNVRPYHIWNMMSYYGAEQSQQDKALRGRFSFNGRIARFVLLLPGQHLDLISKIEYVPVYDAEKEYYVAEPVLVWDICNASDFDAIDIYVYATNNPTNAKAAGETISDYDSSYWSDSYIFAGGGQGCNEAFVCKKLKMDEDHPIQVELDIELAGKFLNGNYESLYQEYDVPSWEIKLLRNQNNN